MKILPIHMLRLAAAMLIASQVALADSKQNETIPFHVRVDFNDVGAPTIGSIEGLMPILESAVRSELAKMTIRPGTSAEHTAFNAILNGNAALALDGDTVTVQNASFFPALVFNGKDSALLYPVYPVNRIRRGDEGMAEFFLRIASDGSVIEIKPLRSTHPDFEQSALRAIRNWQYDPKSLAVETSGIVLIRFHLHGDAHETSQADCPLDRSKPYIEGQSGCLGVMEVEGSLVRIKS